MHNVVLIVLDTVRKDYFDEHAPRIQRLADTTFERCYAPSSWSIPSHASMLTGELPHRHGVHSHNPDYASLETTVMDDLEHRSLSVSANGAVSEAFGFDRLFDEFAGFAGNDERSPTALSFTSTDEDGPLGYLRAARRRGRLAESLLNGLYVKANGLLQGTPVPKFGDFGAAATVDAGRSLARGSEPFFLFLNLIDAHGPQENLRCLDSRVPYSWSSRGLDVETVRSADRAELEEYLERYRDLYAANVRYLDRTVADFVERTRSETDGETAFVVTADHGEELGGPGERDVGHMDFSTPVLHVPLAVIGSDGPTETPSRRVTGSATRTDAAGPGPGQDGDRESETVTDLVTLLDLPTVIRSVARGDPVPDVTRDRVPAERIGMLFYDGDDDYWTRGVRTVYEGLERYEWDTTGAAVGMPVDRSADGDRVDAEIPARMEAAFETPLREYVAAQSGEAADPELSAETERQLQDLGYKV